MWSFLGHLVAMLAIASSLPTSVSAADSDLASSSTPIARDVPKLDHFVPSRRSRHAQRYNLVSRAVTPGSSVSSSTHTYVGCAFSNNGGRRALTGSSTTSSSMTIPKCLAFCLGGGYEYAAAEYGSQCFCGNTLDNGLGTAAPAQDCSYTCGGDSATICGGYSRMSLYKRVAATPPLGCYSDAYDRTLSGTTTSGSTTTPDGCTAFCKSRNFAYAGVEDGNQCFCGNTLNQARKIDDSKCNKPCTGDSSKMCGGFWAMNIYSTGNPPVLPSSSSSSARPSTSSSTASTSRTTSTSSSRPATTTTSSSRAATATSASSSAGASASSGSGVVMASVVGAAAPPAGPSKGLYAHHMVGNTYSYTQSTWADDMNQAWGAGIDGFALNMGSDAHEPNRVMLAYQAAQAHGQFKLFFSLDVTSLGCSTTAHAANIVNIVATYANSTAQAKYGGKTIVSTFAGEYCTFGQGSLNAGWQYVRTLLVARGVNPYIVPALFSDISQFKSYDWMDAEFNWNSGWPQGAAPLTTSSDQSYMSALGTKGYMPAVSPAFFTYYSPQSYNKNWIFRGDDWLLATRMEQLVAMRNNVVAAEIISWNDYGESHYIGPIRADQPNSQGWTNGMPHTAWLSVIKYYAPAFKTGSYPSASDLLVLWSRPHPKAANPSSPSMGRPTGWDNTDDNLYVFVVLASPATVVINSGANVATWNNLPAGPNKLRVNSAAGSIGAKIVRGGSTVKNYNSGAAFNYTLTPVDYNYNYFVGQA